MAPNVPQAGRARGLDWATTSILLSVAGAFLSIVEARVLVAYMLMFALGLVAGVIALRRSPRRNWAWIGIILNSMNLVFNAALVILVALRR